MKHDLLLKLTVIFEIQNKQSSYQLYLSLTMLVSKVLRITKFSK